LVSVNPFGDLRRECEEALAEAFKRVFPEIQVAGLALEKPSSPEYGQLASSLCLEFAKKVNEKPIDVAKALVAAIDKSKLQLVQNVVPAGIGYVNFHANFEKLAKLALESAERLDAEYGLAKTDKPARIIVEHTSVNPLHPLHIGHARNPILGDAVARILKARGHSVSRHYYVDDVGRQSSVIAYGYEKLGRPRPDAKPDHFIGNIYTITSCLIEINRLKKQLERAKLVSAEEEITKTNKELDEWVSIAAELKSRFPSLFDALLEKISKDEDPEGEISKINAAYEAKDPRAEKLVREVSEMCLNGFKQTLSRIGVSFDSWDFESDFVWSNHVAQVLQRLKKLPYTRLEGGVPEFDAEKVVDELGLRKRLDLKEDHKVPSLTLVRSDGTTLYTTRDVAYSLWKFERAEKVINVISMEQNLSQLQLRIALHALGYGKQADNLVHFAYNLVTLPGYKMSSRRGRYITFDEVMDEAVKRAYEEVSKRSPQLSEEEKQRIAEFVGLGAVRYALVQVDTSKPVLFTWDRVLDFEKNSAPYIQYTHARACSIMRKAERTPEKPGYKLLSEALEHEIILAVAAFPDTFTEAAEYLKPNLIADYANALADKFNTFYDTLPVIKAEPSELSDARLALVDSVRIALRNSLSLIGVLAPEKM
jgi:arginyl-tRNA synthetase